MLRCARPTIRGETIPWRNARGARGGKPVRVARLTPVRRCVDVVVDEFRRLCRPKIRDVTRDAISEILKYSVFVKYLRYLGSARAWQAKLYGRRRSSFSRDRSLEKRTRRASHQQRTLVYVRVGSRIDASSDCCFTSHEFVSRERCCDRCRPYASPRIGI